MDSFIAWVGGKKLLRKEIVSQFPDNFNKYVEVFGGAGWVLFYKEKHANNEVYNDINSNLVNLFKCMKYHSNAIAEELDFVLNSRDTFNEYKNQSELEGLTDIQKAARYLYLIKASYGAKVTSFGGKYRDISNIENTRDIKKRLSKVLIENKSFDNLISSHDSTETLFYCDPPYYRAERMYNTGNFVFDDLQHIRLRDILSEIKGKFVLSYNNDDFIKGLYKEYNIEEIDRLNNLALVSGKNKIYKELIIKNY